MKLHDTTTDRIEKEIVLRAPRSRVWRALADAEQFGAWFGIKLDGAFAYGTRVRGQISSPGNEHVTIEFAIERIFAALGDEPRLALVARLSSDGPLSITRLTAGSAVTRQAVTKHLNVLATAGLVSDVRRGRERIWEFEPKQAIAAQSYLEHVSKRWDEALDRLKKFVED